ncbi:hypothetical protein HY483_01400 [Candidatus Woesearchaeota archaeon]|nr:hypothetical protein [Candidatus Woesearchaeota archaeon]
MRRHRDIHFLSPDNDGCDYARVLTPIVGREVAFGNALFLSGRKEGYSFGGIWLLTPRYLKSQGLTSDNVVVRLFRVWGVVGFDDNLSYVSACSNFDDSGRACEVASSQKKLNRK